MDREQIIKALECLVDNYSENGSYNTYVTLRDALALIKSQEQRIKELTEENERLQDLVKEVQEYNENWVADNGRLRGILLEFTDIVHKWGNKHGYDTSEISLVPILNEETAIKVQIKADIVRKMQEMFAVHFGTYTDRDEVKVLEVFRLLGKFAKEMLGVDDDG